MRETRPPVRAVVLCVAVAAAALYGAHAFTTTTTTMSSKVERRPVKPLVVRSSPGTPVIQMSVTSYPASRWASRTQNAKPVAPERRRVAQIASLEAKRKGKAGPGGQMKGRGPPPAVVQQQKEMEQYMKAREGSGFPAFDLYCRGPNSPSWYPCGALGGDDQSKQLVESWMGGLLSDLAKGGLDRGVASSVLQDKSNLVNRVVEQYPQLKKSKAQLKFGYKISYPGLLEKRPQASQITELTEDMLESPLDKVKSAFGFGK